MNKMNNTFIEIINHFNKKMPFEKVGKSQNSYHINKFRFRSKILQNK